MVALCGCPTCPGLLLTRKVSNGYGDMKLEAKIAVSMEYPLRPPFFTLNLIKAAATETKLGDESDQWFNELRAMEAEEVINEACSDSAELESCRAEKAAPMLNYVPQQVKQKDCKPADRENDGNVNRSRKRSNECRFPGTGSCVYAGRCFLILIVVIASDAQNQACEQSMVEAEKDFKKMIDHISETHDTMEASFTDVIAEAQAQATRLCKTTIPELKQSVEKAIDTLRTHYVAAST
ncbi:hypothetical protein Tco_0768119 [Tanacetum coccineum]